MPSSEFCCSSRPQNKNQKKNKYNYLKLAKELRKLWNRRVTVISIAIGALEMITKGLERALEELEIRGWIETIQTTALLRSARIPRRILKTWRDLLSLWLQRKFINKRWCEKLARSKTTTTIIIIIIIEDNHCPRTMRTNWVRIC